MLPLNYELKAPDFSYIMITSLKDFYYNRHALYTASTQIAVQMKTMLHEIYSKIIPATQHLQDTITATPADEYLPSFMDHLNGIITYTTTQFTELAQTTEELEHHPTSILNLDAYHRIPTVFEVT